MRILIIAMADSIHTARWINQIADQGWDVHLFPSIDHGKVHPDLRNIYVHHFLYGKDGNKGHNSVRNKGFAVFFGFFEFWGRALIKRLRPDYRVYQLAKLVEKIRPDIVHSIEFQHAGYLTLEAKKLVKGHFPSWITTSWGSDIYLFGRLSEHVPKIKEVLTSCDYYSCECERDVSLAKSYGYEGDVLPVFPNTGGFDLEKTTKQKQTGPTSQRKVIMLKGYQGWSGRALVGLRALERCADLLQEYTIAIYLASPEVKIAAELFTNTTGISVKIIPPTSHEEILRYHGQARISIGVNISDAISTSFLEALVMGSFPIQSWTGCANEWIEDGKTGILVPPEDSDVIEEAIRSALTDDALVDNAAELNWKTAEKKLDQVLLKSKAVEMYFAVLKDSK